MEIDEEVLQEHLRSQAQLLRQLTTDTESQLEGYRRQLFLRDADLCLRESQSRWRSVRVGTIEVGWRPSYTGKLHRKWRQWRGT